MSQSKAAVRRAESRATEQELMRKAPEINRAIADNDPRRCAAAGVGKFHQWTDPGTGVLRTRCFYCAAEAFKP